MGIGASLFLIAVGAILAFAVTGEVSGIDIEIVGWILLGVGGFGLVLSLLLMSRRRRETYALYDPYDQGPPR
jgi:tellurite resistance protein TehA-like permease